jgi:hypothetical protein
MKMHRMITAATLALAIAVAPALAPLEAKAKDSSSLQIPITGAVHNSTTEKFVGTFTLQRFVNENGKVVAVGTVAGTVSDLSGNVLAAGLQTVAIPVTVVGDRATATRVAPAAVSAAAICPILHLDLGPLTLDLLGLNIDLSRVILDITAVSGAGNLLGNLLCAVTGLLDPGGLAALLNQILDIITAL